MASPHPEEATVAHKPSYWKMSKGDFFPGESFKSWSAYKSALSQTCFRFKDRLMSHSDDANELGEVRQQSKNDMKRCLSWWDLTWFGFGALIEAGIFVLTGQEEHNHAGPGIVLSCVLSGLSVMHSVFCYTEFAVEIPVAGGSFAYLRVELGDFAAFIAAGNILPEGIVGSAVVARGWTSYFTTLLNREPYSLRIHTKLEEGFNLLDPIAVAVLVIVVCSASASGVLLDGSFVKYDTAVHRNRSKCCLIPCISECGHEVGKVFGSSWSAKGNDHSTARGSTGTGPVLHPYGTGSHDSAMVCSCAPKNEHSNKCHTLKHRS